MSGVKIRYQWAVDSSNGACTTLGSNVTVPSSGYIKDDSPADVVLSGSFPTDVTLDVPDTDANNTSAYFTNNTRYCYRVLGFYSATSATTWDTQITGAWVPFLAKVRLPQTITFPMPTIANGTGTAGATATSNLPVTYTSETPTICTVTPSGAIVVLSAGVCTLTASQPGNDDYDPATDVSVSFSVTPGPPVITTNSLPNGTYGTAYSVSLAAAAGSGTYTSYALTSGTLPAGLTFNSNGTISGIPTTVVSSVTLSFTVTDSASATSVVKTLTLTISPAPLTVTAPSHSVTYGDAKPILTATYAGFVNGDTVSSLSTPASCDAPYTTTTPVASSPVTVTCSGVVAPNYSVSYVTGTITISRASVTVTAPSFTRTYGAALGTLTPTYSGWVNGQTTTVLSTAPTCTSTYSSNTPVGQTRPTSCSGAVAANYTFTYVAGVVTVVSGTQTLSAANVTVTYGDPDFTPSASSSAGLPVTLSSSDPTLVTVLNNGKLEFLGVGTVTITVTQPGDSNVAAATPVTFTVTVNPAPLVITALSGTLQQGSPVPTMNPGYSGFVRGQNSSVLQTPATCTTSYTISSVIGTNHPVTCTGATAPNYSISYVAGNYAVVAVSGNGNSNPNTPSTPPSRTRSVTPAPVVVPPVTTTPTTPAPVTTPSPASPSNGLTLASPAQPKAQSAQAQVTVDSGTGTKSSATQQSLIALATKNEAVRSVEGMRSEAISGFAPGASVVISVSGARTTAQFVVTAAQAADPVAVASALTESKERTAIGFARVVSAKPVSQVKRSDLVIGKITEDAQNLFAASGLGNPQTLGSFNLDSATRGIRVTAKAEGYTPGSVVYLAVTTDPIIFGSQVADEQGMVTVDGVLPLDVLESGAHSIRVVGTRDLGGISVDNKGELQLSDDTMREIQKFDGGTNAVVVLKGKSAEGVHAAVRLIPLGHEVPWWSFWVYLGLSVFSLLALWRWPRKRGAQLGVLIAGIGFSLLPLVLAWVTFSYVLIIPTVLTALGVAGAGVLIWRFRRGQSFRTERV